MYIEETTAVDANGGAPERTFRIDLTETELDAIRTVLGRVQGPRTWVRHATSELYYKAQAELGYLDDIRAAAGFIKTRDTERTPTDQRS